MAKLDKKTVSKTIQGYKIGEAFAKKDRLLKLRSLSHKKALAIYSSLWQTWKKSKSGDMQALDRLKTEHLIKRRFKIDQLWHKKAHDRTA